MGSTTNDEFFFDDWGDFHIPSIGEKINWDTLIASPFGSEIELMRQTEQNPLWHAEGNVWFHTKLVLERLVDLDEWKNCNAELRAILFIAALLHDVGKIRCTCVVDNQIVSPNHSSIGARMVREILWRRFGIAGTKVKQCFREFVCSLVRFHSKPYHFDCGEIVYFNLFSASTEGELISDFTVRILATLVEADLRGRESAKTKENLGVLDLYREGAREYECYDSPIKFDSNFSRYKFYSHAIDSPRISLYDDTWGKVLILSGLQGTGKDTFIGTNYPNLPMISLDEIRRELKVSPEDSSDRVLACARERARIFLRRKEPFVWNSTNVSPLFRAPIVDLCSAYNASAKIVYLETSWVNELQRNSTRTDKVPISVLERYLQKLEPPSLREARTVEWRVV